jgi:TonB family protein
MNKTEANRTLPAYELKDELARMCLSSAGRDANQKLAWVNSICLVFLLIGLFGARRGLIAIRPAPPLEQIIPVVVEPMPLPPQATLQKKEQVKTENQTPRVAVVIPSAPNISFSVPTVGSLVVPASLASAPPLEPMRTQTAVNLLNNTGAGGERPQPPYPKIALENAMQGSILLLLGGDAAGNVTSIEVKESSGFPFLDRTTVDFIKQHWHLPTGAGGQLFQTRITYKIQLN